MQKCFNTDSRKINGLHTFPNSKVVVNIFSFINLTVLLIIYWNTALYWWAICKNKNQQKITNKNTTPSKKVSDPEIPWQLCSLLSSYTALCSIIVDVASYFVLWVKNIFSCFWSDDTSPALKAHPSVYKLVKLLLSNNAYGIHTSTQILLTKKWYWNTVNIWVSNSLLQFKQLFWAHSLFLGICFTTEWVCHWESL